MNEATSAVEVTENDIPGTILHEPLENATVHSLRWWLLCHGIRVPSSWRKAKLVLLTLHAHSAPHLSINLAFLHDDGTRIPWQSSHHLRECTVAFSNGSCKIAPGISFSVTSTAEVASFI